MHFLIQVRTAEQMFVNNRWAWYNAHRGSLIGQMSIFLLSGTLLTRSGAIDRPFYYLKIAGTVEKSSLNPKDWAATLMRAKTKITSINLVHLLISTKSKGEQSELDWLTWMSCFSWFTKSDDYIIWRNMVQKEVYIASHRVCQNNILWLEGGQDLTCRSKILRLWARLEQEIASTEISTHLTSIPSPPISSAEKCAQAASHRITTCLTSVINMEHTFSLSCESVRSSSPLFDRFGAHF